MNQDDNIKVINLYPELQCSICNEYDFTIRKCKNCSNNNICSYKCYNMRNCLECNKSQKLPIK